MVHLGAGISHNLDVLGQELVAVLSDGSVSGGAPGGAGGHLQGQRGQGTEIRD